jgi:hypothetical protein
MEAGKLAMSHEAMRVHCSELQIDFSSTKRLAKSSCVVDNQVRRLGGRPLIARFTKHWKPGRSSRISLR